LDNDIRVCILTRNRYQYLRRALDSALSQKNVEISIIISDNSDKDNHETENMMMHDFNNVEYIRRSPPISMEKHFQTVLRECKEKYLIIFHDDDIMKENFIDVLLKEIKKDDKIIAVGCNAQIINDSGITNMSLMGRFRKKIIINSAESMANYFFSLWGIKPAPFSSYIFNARLIKAEFFNWKHGGIHFDVSFLLKAVRQNNIVWIPDCLMYYRTHANNVGGKEYINDRIGLLRYVWSHTEYARHSIVTTQYRYMAWKRWYEKYRYAKNKAHPYREKIVRKFLIATKLKFILIPSVIWIDFSLRVFKVITRKIFYMGCSK
jgi:glycosyltransferase involved in cell wall biosynthesis